MLHTFATWWELSVLHCGRFPQAYHKLVPGEDEHSHSRNRGSSDGPQKNKIEIFAKTSLTTLIKFLAVYVIISVNKMAWVVSSEM
jgi:hypothetical protein